MLNDLDCTECVKIAKGICLSSGEHSAIVCLLPDCQWLRCEGIVVHHSGRFAASVQGTVAVVTADGRMIVGTLKGFDQTINLILDESHERVFSSQQGVEQVVLGLYIVRGDNVDW
ncbi:LSM8 homolog, U6 small nuclear RNA associated isoform X2 [Chiloscyllium plagiosum]|uniref:LSM8 homolog, U6 small nuclear RNA associated isoform X2 n=1 Tax=Chiloscyllium plagiosum TaxID=36176 RepID=UPI001CB853F7|nr:LSM8 homolog, U6 small nuclear RNA associated isoform X2 [Chiloscyllium plagiosum]